MMYGLDWATFDLFCVPVPVPSPVAVQGRQHHVRGVQRVDEVGREGVLLLHCVWSPVKEKSGRERKEEKEKTR